LFLPIDERHESIQLKNKRAAVARILASLDRPLYLLDTRRNGCGGQGSWSPREFATEIPAMMGSAHNYAFVHLPAVAPSIELLAWGRGAKPDWREFRKRYEAELAAGAVRVAAACRC
jgi:hypothetical protein